MKNTHLKNINENDLQESLRRDAEIPAVVHDKVNKAYRIIESRKIVQKPAPADPFRPRYWPLGLLSACLIR